MSGRRVLRVGLLLAAAWIVVAAVQLTLAYVHLRAGEAAAEKARGGVNVETVRSGELQAQVEDAHDRFGRAHGLLTGPVLGPVRILPVAGRQIRTLAAMSEATGRAAGAALAPLAEARRFLTDAPAGDQARLRSVERMAETLEATRKDIDELDLGPSDALFRPIATRRVRLASELEELRIRVDDAAAISGGMAELLAGPRRYLLFAANNAEMRAGSGMFLSAGEVTFSEGGMEIGDVDPTAELRLSPDTAPPIDGDLEARWGWLEPNRDFRNLAVTPRFDVSAQLALRMWEARTGDRLDGVIAVDAAALAAVLDATGSVRLGDTVVEPDEAVDFVLHDQYETFGTVGAEQEARRDALGQLASAAFERVASGEAELGPLFQGLSRAARARHILVWSRRPAEQAAWSAAGLAGQLDENSLGVMLLNRGGNKLDYFVRVRAALDVASTPERKTITVRVTMQNGATGDEIPYVAGPHPDVDAVPGEYVGLLAVTLPADARRSRFAGGRPLAAAGEDGSARVVATEVRILPRDQLELVFTTELPADRTSVTLVPSARIPPVRWIVGDDRFTGDRRHTIALE